MFSLSIELGNEGMNCAKDVAQALREIAKRLERNDPEETGDCAKVYDINGNAVGSWDYDHQPEEDDDPSDSEP